MICKTPPFPKVEHPGFTSGVGEGDFKILIILFFLKWTSWTYFLQFQTNVAVRERSELVETFDLQPSTFDNLRYQMLNSNAEGAIN